MNQLRDIPGYEGRYAISECGSIWSHPKKFGQKRSRTHGGKWMAQRPTEKGYMRVTLLRDSGLYSSYPVHRLVALTYIPNPELLPQINHKNGNKQDNSAANLEWCSARDNIRHALVTGLVKTKTPAKLAASRRNIVKAYSVRHVRRGAL